VRIIGNGGRLILTITEIAIPIRCGTKIAANVRDDAPLSAPCMHETGVA
jgi:hypothetical protein